VRQRYAAFGFGVVTPHRPLLRWFGGKWLIAPWILASFPPHTTYVEPYGGAASLMIRKPRSEVEVLNDLDDRLTTLYRVMRHPSLHLMLAIQLENTLFSRSEFKLSCLPVDSSDYDDDDYAVEVARRLIVRGSMGFGTGKEGSDATGFRDYTGPARSAPVKDWDGVADSIRTLQTRFKGVIIDCCDAVKVIKRHDSPTTLHYVDPPYVGSTRAERERSRYLHELDDAGHRRLLDALLGAKGMVVLSGYTNELYSKTLRGWTAMHREFGTTGGNRIETIWLNPAAVAGAKQPALDLSVDTHGRLLPAFS
jgi:DNA adenine methylase